MKSFLSLALIFCFYVEIQAQISTRYTVSFDNAIHHEAQIIATFSNLKNEDVVFRMSRSSPGRYALHEFVKNVYNVEVTDGKGNGLKATRQDPYSWQVKGHDGTIVVNYTLFANHGDGTYAQIDETHAHLNGPASFMYAPELSDQGIHVTFDVREDLGWKVATQLKHESGNTYYAKDFQYFMDSPTEISNYRKQAFKVGDQTINFVLHDYKASDEDFSQYMEMVKKIVLQQEKVYGELPKFDYGEYTFLACYLPNVSGDGMEHRNSTVLTTTRSLAHGGIENNIGTVSHEFFHCWNVERIRPQDLEPFDFSKANMSGALWFAEGFTNYYDALILCRTETWSIDKYLSNMAHTFNAVWTSPGRQFFNPIEMSYQAPFVDAARSIDDTNRENTYISYYTYGEMLGLALDLSLREIKLNLDDYMKLIWNEYGKAGKYYSIKDLRNVLISYAGKDFGNFFFDNYIYKSDMPDFERLFSDVGIDFVISESKVSFGALVMNQKIMDNPKMGSTAYVAGFQKGDKILKVGPFDLNPMVSLEMALSKFNIGDTVSLKYLRHDEVNEIEMTLLPEKMYSLSLLEKNSISESQVQNQSNWLNAKQ